MSRFLQATRAEFIKITTTRTWWILAIIMFLYLGFSAASIGFVFGAFASDMGAIGEDGSIAMMIYAVALTMGFFFPVLLGALSVTGEYRHRTIVPTFLTVASRPTALAAKLASQFLFGLLFGVIAYASTILTSVFFLAWGGIDTGLGSFDNWMIILRSILAMAIWATIGIGVGALIPNQAAVLVVVIGFTQFIEPILRLAASFNDTFGAIGRFLPGAVSDGFGGASFYSMMTGVDVMGSGGGAASLTWWASGLVLLAYAVLAIGAGYWARWRRDVR